MTLPYAGKEPYTRGEPRAKTIKRADSAFLSMFRDGKDTYEISLIFIVPEHEVWRGIHEARASAHGPFRPKK